MDGQKFKLEYDIVGAGWAMATITCGASIVEMPVSYVHDSLRELAIAVHRISRGSAVERVIFMDEPGEHQLYLKRDGSPLCSFQVIWFHDWDSWGLRSKPGSEKVIEGKVTTKRLLQQAYTAMWLLHEKYGEDGYLEQWGEHPFPIREMLRLAGKL